MDKYDVAVVGGGTIGSYFALVMSKKGYNVVVFEENEEVGVPQHCSGLVSINGFKRIGLWNILKREGLITNYIKGARFYGISGNYKEILLPNPIAVVIDRVNYDKTLANLAIENGTEYLFKSPVKEIRTDGNLTAKINGETKTLYSEVIIDAEGARRRLISNLPSVHHSGLLSSIQIDIKAVKETVPIDTVELHFNVDDFFSWVIPISDSRPVYRVGLSSNKLRMNPYNFLKNFAKKRIGKYKEIRKFGGIVVSSGPLPRYVWGKILAIGDAAGHVKPTTGGGIVLGSIGAYIAANTVHKYLNGSGRLMDYQDNYNSLLGLQYKAMILARSTLNKLRKNGTDLAIRLLPQAIFSNLKADMDLQLEALLKLMFPILNFLWKKR